MTITLMYSPGVIPRQKCGLWLRQGLNLSPWHILHCYTSLCAGCSAVLEDNSSHMPSPFGKIAFSGKLPHKSSCYFRQSGKLRERSCLRTPEALRKPGSKQSLHKCSRSFQADEGLELKSVAVVNNNSFKYYELISCNFVEPILFLVFPQYLSTGSIQLAVVPLSSHLFDWGNQS